MAQMPLAKHDDMIKTFPSDRADQPLRMPILPSRSWRGRSVTNPHRAKTPFEYLAIDAVAISNEISRRCPYRKLDPAGARPRIGRCFVLWRTCSN